ncbi:MAG: GAF domain-containing protein, partial [Anaerolineae bacterium]
MTMRRLLYPSRDLGLQLLGLYLLLTVPFLIALVIFNQVIGQHIQADVRANDLSLARAIAQETDITISNALKAVEQLGAYPGVVEGNIDEMEALFSVVLNTRPDVNLVYRLDESGIMLYHYPTGPGSTLGVDFSFREYYQRARRTRQSLVSKGRISPTTQQPVATAVMPLWSEDGHFLGLVATNIKLESLSQSLVEIVAGHRPEEDFQAIILDADAQVIAHPDPDLLLKNAADILPGIYLDALAGKTDSVIARDAAGEERLYTYAPIPSAGWAVIISRPTDVAFATQNTIRRLALGAFATLLVVGLFIWIVLSRRVILPIEHLASISQAIGEGREIGPEERRQLTYLAERDDQIGHLIRTILRMEQAIKARIQEQATLLETSSAVVSSLDPQTVLNRILEQVGRLLNVKMCAIVALDEQHGVFRIRASRGLSKRYTEQLAIQPSEPFSVSMRALRSRKPVQVSDTETDPSFAVQRPRARAEGYRSLLAVPLNTQHAPPSALLVYRKEPHVFSEDEIRLLVSFANHATMAIENAVLYARSDMRLQEETRRIEALIQSLHDGLIMGDPYGKVIYANRRIKELAD